MKRAATRFVAIAGMTCNESLRQPLTMLLLVAAIVLSILPPFIWVHPLGDARRLARDSALAVHFVFGMALAVYLVANAFDGDRRRGTAAVLLSKPVSRDMAYLGKLTGIVVVLLVFSLDLAACTLAAERVAARFVIQPEWTGSLTDTRLALGMLAVPLLSCFGSFVNYRRTGRSFAAGVIRSCSVLLPLVLVLFACFDRAGYWAPFDLRANLSLVPTSALVAMALCAAAAVSMAVATRLDTSTVVTLATGIILTGMLSADLVQDIAAGSGYSWLTALLPNWQHFWMADALAQRQPLPPGFLAWAALYAASLAGMASAIGLWLFKRADIR